MKHWIVAIIVMFFIALLTPYLFGADTWDDYQLSDCCDHNDDDSDGCIKCSDLLNITIYSDPYYTYDPKPDITIYELSLIMPIFFGGSSLYVDGLPPEAKRHFRKENE